MQSHRALPALGLADHRQQAEVEHHVGELVHPRGGGRAGRADHLAHHRIDRADIVDRPARKSTGSSSPRASMSWMRLCAASRPVSIRR
jgi:hypothetical protein